MWVCGQRHVSTYAGERRCTHCIGDWVGPQGQSGRIQKISPPPDFDPLTVQPVASRYTEYVIPAHQKLINFLLNTSFWFHFHNYVCLGFNSLSSRMFLN